MGLFSPWFLAGLAALGLPLWLHLLRQFKRTPQPFSSLMFFERQIQSSSKHRRLRYLTLLGLRMALLLLLALLFANPFVNRASNAVTPRTLHIVVIDRSFSMRYQGRLADAKSQATQLVNSFTGSQNYQVAALGSHLTMLTQPESDKSAVKQALASVEEADEASSYGEFSRALRVMEQSTGLALDVHLFTDAQQTSMPTAFSDLKLGLRTSLTIHAIGKPDTPNWAVQTVTAPAGIFDTEKVRVTAGIAGWQTAATTRRVSILLDGREIASKDAAIPASGRAEVVFDELTVPYGTHRGEVRIEPRDSLPNDDRFAFSIERSDPRKVLFLYSAGRAADSFFYKSALNASPSTGLQVQPGSLAQISDIDLSQFALIVLDNPGDLDELTNRRLIEYASKGGAILIGVGPATIQAGIVPLAGDRISQRTTVQGAAGNVSPPLAAGAFDNVEFVATPRIAVKANDRMMARFADGSPLLFEQMQGEGRLLVFASTLDNSTSDFPLHASFVPFVAATGSYLSGSSENLSSFVVGSAITLRRSKNQSTTADVIGPDGKHEIGLNDAARLMAFNPPREGFYEVHPAGGKRLLVAVDADRRESNLAKVPADTLILWRNTSKGDGSAPAAGSGVTRVPFSLWRYILTLVLIAAVVESIFATRYLSEERQAS